MTSTTDIGKVTTEATGRADRPRRFGGLASAGFAATLGAIAATVLAAAAVRAAGVDYEVAGGERIPLGGFAVLTGLCCTVGIVLAAALRRWSARPAKRFVWTAVALTAVSLLPPSLLAADAATSATLIGLHLIPAAVMIPTLARLLSTRPA